MIILMVVFLCFNIVLLSFFIKSLNERVIFSFFSIVRLILCIVGTYYSLPFAGGDAVTFNNVAVEQANDLTFIEILEGIDVTRSYFISSITAILYKIFEINFSIPIFLNGYIGILILFYSIKLFDVVWGGAIRGRLLFLILIGLSPILNIHSAILLRENFIALFILLASIEFCKYVDGRNMIHALKFILFTLLASFFHGAMIIFVMLLPIYAFLSGTLSLDKKIFFICFFIAIFVGLFYIFDFKKITGVVSSETANDVADSLAKRVMPTNLGDTAYLVGLEINGFMDIIWQTPIRMINFLLQPFIWNVKTSGHFIVFLDGLFWLLILIKLTCHWKSIFRNKKALYLLIGIIILILAFSFGTVNFGTAIRHRSKFLIEMLVFVVPFFILNRVTLGRLHDKEVK